MPIPVKCGSCGSAYHLKDDLAGRVVRCPKCNASISVGQPAPGAGVGAAAPRAQADAVFDRDKFLLRQKHLAISEKYTVFDEHGQPILFVLRPAHILRQLLAVMAGLVCGFVLIPLSFVAISKLPSPVGDVLGALMLLLFFPLTVVVIFLLAPLRHVTFYRDETCQEKLVEVHQVNKVALPSAHYEIRDAGGGLLARLRKNYLYNIIRKRWICAAPDGAVLCVAKEDSIILSLLRRFLGPFFGLLRTNFIILRGESEDIVGEFNRKFTLLDRYVLDLTSDAGRQLDRRVMLALGVMLDTGEKR